jgi:carbohydrate kinase (thermoresistant glucokinase family)
MQKTAMSPICREPNSTLTWHPRDAAPAVVMGVSGSGRSTVGKALAERLGWEFQEGDTLHPPENIAKMSAGEPLDLGDRAPWLAAIAAEIDRWRRRGTPRVISCSALNHPVPEIVVTALSSRRATMMTPA